MNGYSIDDFEEIEPKSLEERQKEWKEIGTKFKTERTLLRLTLKQTSKRIGVSATTLRNFEEGKPISRSKLVQASYTLFLELYSKGVGDS